jgi:hypothetical protein
MSSRVGSASVPDGAPSPGTSPDRACGTAVVGLDPVTCGVAAGASSYGMVPAQANRGLLHTAQFDAGRRLADLPMTGQPNRVARRW